MGFMAQPAKAQEPTMEEILASIRRIIADDDAAKPQSKPPSPKPPEPVAKAAPPAPAAPNESMGQDDIDAMLSAVDDDLDDVAPTQSEAPVEVLELTEAMAAPSEPKPPAFRKIDAEQDVVFDEPPPPPPPQQPPPPRPDPVQTDGSEPALLSPAATAVVNSAFGTLAHSMLVQNAKTLEDLVKEMLRPLLKAWLDDNLPTLVERLVRAEIERVSRGRPG
jgi:uncharacterized protein